MPYSREQLPTGIVKTQIKGVMGHKQSLDSLNDLYSYVNDKKLYELVVHEQGSAVDVGYEEAAVIVSRAKELFSSLDAGAIAFVSDDDLIFGLCRQLQMQINNKVQIAVFRNESTAVQWLAELKQAN